MPDLQIKGSALCAVLDTEIRCHQATPAHAAHNPALFIRVSGVARAGESVSPLCV